MDPPKRPPPADAASPQSRKKTKKSKKPDGQPNRPLSAYNFFFKEERVRLLREIELRGEEAVAREAEATSNGEGSTTGTGSSDSSKKTTKFQLMGKIIGRRWKTLQLEERSKYDSQADKDLQRYREAMEGYNEAMIRDSNIGKAALARGGTLTDSGQLDQRSFYRVLSAASRAPQDPNSVAEANPSPVFAWPSESTGELALPPAARRPSAAQPQQPQPDSKPPAQSQPQSQSEGISGSSSGSELLAASQQLQQTQQQQLGATAPTANPPLLSQQQQQQLGLSAAAQQLPAVQQTLAPQQGLGHSFSSLSALLSQANQAGSPSNPSAGVAPLYSATIPQATLQQLLQLQQLQQQLQQPPVASATNQSNISALLSQAQGTGASNFFGLGGGVSQGAQQPLMSSLPQSGTQHPLLLAPLQQQQQLQAAGQPQLQLAGLGATTLPSSTSALQPSAQELQRLQSVLLQQQQRQEQQQQQQQQQNPSRSGTSGHTTSTTARDSPTSTNSGDPP